MRKEKKRTKGQKHPKWIIEVDVRALAMLAVAIVMCVLFVISCVFFVRGLLRVGHMEVVGITQYRHEQIINASGMARGDLLYGTSFEEIEERILSGCPYVRKVEVSGHFPDTLRFTVIEERSPQWYISLADDFYVLDEDLVMLTETHSEEMLLEEGVTRLWLPKLNSVMQYEVPMFGIDESGERDERLVRQTAKVIDTIRQSSFKSRMTELDVRDLSNIILVVDGKYRVEVGGDIENLSARLREVERILDSEQVRRASSGTVYAASSPAFFREQ